ncbi:MAG: origin recognition complex subunit 2-domain-containing protein [Podila humilis]|nr:MAG: origin recognition complex subunit 2-domain-containing protein [Podila humilis]
MVCLVYQRNDEIPTHIINKVSSHDVELELALAKKRRRLITTIGNNNVTSQTKSNPQRTRHMTLVTGLTVAKPSTNTGQASKSKDEDSSLQDIFLPTLSSTNAAKTTGPGNENEDEAETNAPSVKHARGREVFGFQSSRKPAGLKSILDHEGASISDPTQHTTAPPKPRRGKKAEQEVQDEEMTQEQHSKRRKVAQTISRLNKAGSDDEEDEEEEEDDDSDDDEGQVPRSENDIDQARDIMEVEPQKSIFEEDEMGAERYFQDLYQKSRTSNNTLSKLPTLEQGDFVQALKRAPAKHTREMEMLTLLYEEQFPQWYFELVSGFNLLIYGYGSKRQLLTKFATTMLTDAPLIIVNGYFPTLNLKDILDKILSTALQYSGPAGTLQEQIAFIHAYFKQPDRAVQKLYLLVHNIDGSGLRSEKAQTALSLLASCPQIHMVASIDHINANILWDTVKAARFQWCWHELTTFKSYLAETSFENSIMVRQGELGARGIQFVLASLTSNGKGLFKVLAEHQIQNERESAGSGSGEGKNQTDLGMAYNALFKKCQENFLVSTAVTFRTQLTEFRDHRIVQSKKGADGVEILYIPLSANVLEGILDNMSS